MSLLLFVPLLLVIVMLVFLIRKGPSKVYVLGTGVFFICVELGWISWFSEFSWLVNGLLLAGVLLLLLLPIKYCWGLGKAVQPDTAVVGSRLLSSLALALVWLVSFLMTTILTFAVILAIGMGLFP